MAILRFKTGLVLGLGVGYVLGTRAGRERYLQIMELWTKVRGDERVGTVVDKAVELMSAPADQVRECDLRFRQWVVGLRGSYRPGVDPGQHRRC